jgi:phage protein D
MAGTGFDVTIGGQKLGPKVLTHVASLTVDLSLDKTGMFIMEMAASEEPEEEDSWVDDKLFDVGKPIQVKIGQGSNLEFLFSGEIYGLEPSFSIERPPNMTLRSYDHSQCLQKGTRNRTFAKLRYSDIARTIAGEAHLTPDIKDSPIVYEFIYQANQSNLSFLREMAREINYQVRVEDKTLIFRPTANEDHEVMTLTMEKDLIEFSARLSMAQQVTEVVVNSWNPKEKKEITGRARANDSAPAMGKKNSAGLGSGACANAVEIVSWRPVMSQAEADEMAKARLGESGLKLIEGNGSMEGRTDLRPGKVIKIDGLGHRFSGPYYVTDTTHRLDQENGYRTHFNVRRNAI